MRAFAAVVALGGLAACSGKPHPPDARVQVAPRDAARPPSVAPDAAAAQGPADPPRAEHVAFDFVDNRHAAHRAVGGDLVVDAGDIGFARYTDVHPISTIPWWSYGQTVDGVRVATLGMTGSLEVPLPVAAHHSLQQLALRVHVDRKVRLIVHVNLRKLGTFTLSPGWQVVAAPVPPGDFVVGENKLVLEVAGKSEFALHWLRIGPPGASLAGDPLAAATFDAKADAIDLDRDAELAWYVTLPDGANLVADVPAPCRVEIGARAGDDSLAAGVLSADHHRVDLSASAGKVVRLALTARDCPRVRIAHPRITLFGAAPPAPPAPPPPRFVILWVIDALSADRLVHAPNFDELARVSTSFRRFWVPGNTARAGNTGLFESHYGDLEPGASTLATELAAAGFATLARTENDAVLGEAGASRGYAEFRGSDAGAVLPAALGQLAAYRDRGPAFLYIGTIDHAKALGVRARDFGCPPGDPAARAARYDAATVAVDQQLGRLVAQLRAWGIWDQTMLIVTADHGAELGERGTCGAGASLRDAELRVPLFVHDPARFPAGVVVDEGAEAADVMPTILAAIGRPVPPGALGGPLEDLAQGRGRLWARATFAETFGSYAVRVGRWKAIAGYYGAPAIVDMASDPNETTDVAATHPIERRMLTDNLRLWLATHWQKAAWGPTTNVTPAGAAALDAASAP